MRLNATADMHGDFPMRFSKEAFLTHLVDDKVVSFAPQIVGQIAVFAEFHYHHQWACQDSMLIIIIAMTWRI